MLKKFKIGEKVFVKTCNDTGVIVDTNFRYEGDLYYIINLSSGKWAIRENDVTRTRESKLKRILNNDLL